MILVNFSFTFILYWAQKQQKKVLLFCQISYSHYIFFLQFPLFIPMSFVLGCVFMIIVSFWAAPFECLVGSSIILTGIPAYLLGYKWKKPHVVKKMLGE